MTTIHCCCVTSFKACFWGFFSRSSISHIMYSCSLLKPKGVAPYHLSASLNFVHTFLNKASKELAHMARMCLRYSGRVNLFKPSTGSWLLIPITNAFSGTSFNKHGKFDAFSVQSYLPLFIVVLHSPTITLVRKEFFFHQFVGFRIFITKLAKLNLLCYLDVKEGI